MSTTSKLDNPRTLISAGGSETGAVSATTMTTPAPTAMRKRQTIPNLSIYSGEAMNSAATTYYMKTAVAMRAVNSLINTINTRNSMTYLLLQICIHDGRSKCNNIP